MTVLVLVLLLVFVLLFVVVLLEFVLVRLLADALLVPLKMAQVPKPGQELLPIPVPVPDP
jgi:hypothetical protein